MIGQYETSRDHKKTCECWLTAWNHCTPHFHSSLELTYVMSGRLTGVVNGQMFELTADQLILSPSYSLHQIISAPDEAESIVMTVPLDFIPSVKKLLAAHEFKNIYAALGKDNQLKPVLMQLSGLCALKNGQDILKKGYTYTVIGMLVDILGLIPVKKSGNTDFAREVLLYMDDHYAEGLTAEKTAAVFGYSKSHFMHLFSDDFGFGFSEYLNILRCRNAAVLIKDEEKPLLEAAMSVGYNSIRSFYRNFKQVFGVTPTEYANSREGGDAPNR